MAEIELNFRYFRKVRNSDCKEKMDEASKFLF